MASRILPPELVVNPATGEITHRQITETKVGNWMDTVAEVAARAPILLPKILKNTWIYLSGAQTVFIERLSHLTMCCQVSAKEPGTEIFPTFMANGASIKLKDLKWVPPADMALLLCGYAPQRVGRNVMFTTYILAMDLRKDGMVYMLPITNQYNDGHMCLGPGNEQVQVPKGNDPDNWIGVRDAIREQLSQTEWFADSLFTNSWRSEIAMHVFKWGNADGWPQVDALTNSDRGHWTQWAARSVSVAVINPALAELHKEIGNA